MGLVGFYISQHNRSILGGYRGLGLIGFMGFRAYRAHRACRV